MVQNISASREEAPMHRQLAVAIRLVGSRPSRGAALWLYVFTLRVYPLPVALASRSISSACSTIASPVPGAEGLCKPAQS